MLFSVAFSVVIVALGAVIYGYRSFRHEEVLAKRYRLAIASVFCAPLFLVLVLIGVIRVVQAIPLLSLENLLPAALFYLIIFPVLFAYFIVPTFLGIGYLALTTAFVGFAWYSRPETLWHKALLAINTGTLLTYIGYVLWWYLTGQVHDTL